mmetsp:Transcript_8221/g.30032  ORF Transcript_8221/g.30032 Transcript_8221/m.30032 type:complete len:349 (-) Transcript_8221:776-1822(-)
MPPRVLSWPGRLVFLFVAHLGCLALGSSDIELHPSLGGGGTMITLNGLHISTAPAAVFCRMGEQLIFAQLSKDSTTHVSVILCEVPQLSTGFISVDVTLNGRDYTNAGLYFEYVTTSIWNVFPKRVDPLGGSLVMVQGQGFRNGCVCDGGTGSFVQAAIFSSALLFCEILAKISTNGTAGIPLTIAVTSTQNESEHIDVYVLGYSRVFEITGVVHNFALDGSLGSEFIVEGNFFGSDSITDELICKCLFGSVLTFGRQISSTSCSCVLPELYPGRHTLLFSNNQAGFAVVDSFTTQTKVLPIALNLDLDSTFGFHFLSTISTYSRLSKRIDAPHLFSQNHQNVLLCLL